MKTYEVDHDNEQDVIMCNTIAGLWKHIKASRTMDREAYQGMKGKITA